MSSLELGQPSNPRAWAKETQASGVTNGRGREEAALWIPPI